MDAIKQYLDLYRNHRDIIDRGAASTLNSMREDASSVIENLPRMPKKGDEHYPVVDVDEMLQADYGLNLNRHTIQLESSDSFKCAVPTLPAYLFMVWGDMLLPSAKKMQYPWQVVSMHDAHASLKPLLDEYYGSVADIRNPLVALNTMLVQDGVVIHVPAGVKVEKPIQIINYLKSAQTMMAVRRILVVLEQESEASIVMCEHTAAAENKLLSLQTVEIIARKGASLQWYDLEESTPNAQRLNSIYLAIDEDASVTLDGITISNGTTRNEYYCTMRAPGANLHLYGMAIEDGERKLDTYSSIRHHAASCHSNELFKYVADDKAHCGFEGLIYVDYGATHTESYQANRNLLGSSDAKIYSRPQLEIYNDDVKCSHGSAIGQLDATQLFYMRTRGIAEADARLLLKQAFMSEIVEAVKLEPLKQRLRVMVERRMAGDSSAGCAECGKSVE